MSVVGDARKMLHTPFSFSVEVRIEDSSGGESTTKTPSTPHANDNFANFLYPRFSIGFKYPIRTTGVCLFFFLNFFVTFNASCMLVFFFRDLSIDFWITVPSAIGSVKGTPSSIKSTPASTRLFINL